MVGSKIRERRKELEWTQRELADRVGVKQSFISSVESNKQTITIDLLLKISNELQKSPSYFFEDEAYDYSHEEYDNDYFVEDTIAILEEYNYNGQFREMHQIINTVSKTEYFKSKIQQYRLEQYRAKAYFGQKQYLKSLEVLNALTTQSLPFRNSLYKSFTLKAIGLCYLQMGKLHFAVAYLKEAYETISKAKYRYDSVLYHEILFHLGITYQNMGNREEALHYLKKSKKWIECVLKRSHYGECLQEVCKIYISNEKYKETITTIQKAVNYFLLINNMTGLNSILETTATLASKTDDNDLFDLLITAHSKTVLECPWAFSDELVEFCKNINFKEQLP